MAVSGNMTKGNSMIRESYPAAALVNALIFKIFPFLKKEICPTGIE